MRPLTAAQIPWYRGSWTRFGSWDVGVSGLWVREPKEEYIVALYRALYEGSCGANRRAVAELCT